MSGQDSELEEGEINGDDTFNESSVIETTSSAFQDALKDFKRHKEGQFTRSTLADRNYGRHSSSAARHSKHNFKSKDNPKSSPQYRKLSTKKNYKKPVASKSRNSSGNSAGWTKTTRPKEIVRHDDIRNSHSSRKSYQEAHRNRNSGTHKRSPRRSSHDSIHDKNHFPETAVKHTYKKGDITYHETDHTKAIQKSSRRVAEIPGEWKNHDISPSKICRTISNDSYINKTTTTSSNTNENNPRTVELQKENDFIGTSSYLKHLKGNSDPFRLNVSVDMQEPKVLVKPFSNDKDDEVIEIPVVKEKREPELIVIDSSDETEPDQDDVYEELELRKAALEGLFKNLKTKEQVEEHDSKEVEDLQALRSHLLADMANKTNNNHTTQEIPNEPDNAHWMKTFKPVTTPLAAVQTSEVANTRPTTLSTTTQSSTAPSVSATSVSQQSHLESSGTTNPLVRPIPRHWSDRKNPNTEAEIKNYLHELASVSAKDYLASLREAAKYDNMLPAVPSSKSVNSTLSSTKKTNLVKPSSCYEPPQRSAPTATPRTVEMIAPIIRRVDTFDDTSSGCRMQSISMPPSNDPQFSNPDIEFFRRLPPTLHPVQTQSGLHEAETGTTFNYEHVSIVPILPQTFTPQSVADLQGQPLFPRVSDANRFFQPQMHLAPLVSPPGAGILGAVPTAFLTNNSQTRGLLPTPSQNHLQFQPSCITNIPNGGYSTDQRDSRNVFINSDNINTESSIQQSQNTSLAGSPFCFGQDSQLQVYCNPPQTPQQRTPVMHSNFSPSHITSPTMYVNPKKYSVTPKGATGLAPPKNSDGTSLLLPTEKFVVNSLVTSNPATPYHKFLSGMITNGQYTKDEDNSSTNEPSNTEVILPDTNLSRTNNENSSIVANATSSNPRVGNLIILSCPAPEITKETNMIKNNEPTQTANICKIENQIPVDESPTKKVDSDPTDGSRETSDDNASFDSDKRCPIPRKKSTPSVAVKDETMKSPNAKTADVNNPPSQNVNDANTRESAVVPSTPLTPAAPIVKSESSPVSSASVPAASIPIKLVTDSPTPVPAPLSSLNVLPNSLATNTTVPLCGPPIVNNSTETQTANSSKQKPMSTISNGVKSISPPSTSSISKNTVVPAKTMATIPSSSSANKIAHAKWIPAASSTTSSSNQSNVIKGTDTYRMKLANYDNLNTAKRNTKFRTNNTNTVRKGSAPVAFKESKPTNRILIPLGDDSSSDEDTQSRISLDKDKANSSGGKGSSANAPLPANFNAMLDAMLKSAREKAQRPPPQTSDEIINDSLKEIKVKTDDASNKGDGRSSKQSSSATSTSKPENENAREKEELELRERLLRATLMKKMKKSHTQLQLFSNEKKLVNSRATTTDMFQQLHSSMIKFKEKRNVVKDVHQKMLNLRKQLETEEKRLLIAKKSVNVIASEVKERSVNAFRMRQVCLDLKKTCSEMGAEVSGPQYKLPVQGEASLNAIVADVRKQTSMMKEFNESNVDILLTPVGSPKPMPASTSSSNGLVSQLSTSSSSAVRNVSYFIDITPSNDSDPPHPQILVPSTRFLNVLSSSVSDIACGPPSRLSEALPCTFTEYKSPLAFNKSKGKN